MSEQQQKPKKPDTHSCPWYPRSAGTHISTSHLNVQRASVIIGIGAWPIGTAETVASGIDTDRLERRTRWNETSWGWEIIRVYSMSLLEKSSMFWNNCQFYYLIITYWPVIRRLTRFWDVGLDNIFASLSRLSAMSCCSHVISNMHWIFSILFSLFIMSTAVNSNGVMYNIGIGIGHSSQNNQYSNCKNGKSQFNETGVSLTVTVFINHC